MFLVLAAICAGFGVMIWVLGDKKGLDVGYVVLAGLGALLALGFAVRANRRLARVRLEEAVDDLALRLRATTQLGETLESNLQVAQGLVKGSTSKRATAALRDLDDLHARWAQLPEKPRASYVGAMARMVERSTLPGTTSSQAAAGPAFSPQTPRPSQTAPLTTTTQTMILNPRIAMDPPSIT